MPNVALGIPVDNSAQNHRPSDCDPYLWDDGILKEYLLPLSIACKCDNGFENCKDLDYDPKDGHLSCQQTTSDICRWWGNGAFDLWKEEPRKDDEYCTKQYNICWELDTSCN